jgi:CRP/FNR family transcriptional regulator, cyclic AMP receptor protein
MSGDAQRGGEVAGLSQALKRVPLFSNVPEPYLGEIAARIRTRRFDTGEVVFHQQDIGVGLYLIARGAVRVFLVSANGQELTLARFGPGEFFGELAVIDEEPRSATAVAVGHTELMILHREEFLEYLKLRPEAAIFCLRVLARRLRSTDEHLGDLAFLGLPGRLAKTLLDLGADHGTESPEGGIRVGLRLTQTEIATMVGGSRPTVNQLLQRFRRLGWLRTEDRCLVIVQPERLRRLIS